MQPMKTIEFTNLEKMLVEGCVRRVLCGLLDKEDDMIDNFTATLFNLSRGNFGDQECEVKDTDDWIAQLENLRSCLRKLETQEWKDLTKETGAKEYRLPEESSPE
jgi:hypothetical protein